VTVIATGFDQAVEMAAPTLKTIISNKVEVPVAAGQSHQENVSFYRKSNAAGGTGSFSFDGDDLDIPTFKRKM